MISPTTLSQHDANQIRAAVHHDNGSAFDAECDRMMRWSWWDEQERNEAVVAWMAYALGCFLERIIPDDVV